MRNDGSTGRYAGISGRYAGCCRVLPVPGLPGAAGGGAG